MDCDAKQAYVNDYVRQLWHKPIDMEKGSKESKQKHRKGQEANSEGSLFHWGFLKQRKLEAYPYENTANSIPKQTLIGSKRLKQNSGSRQRTIT